MAEGKTKPEFSVTDRTKIDQLCSKFEQAMDNDFNTPEALGYLFELKDFASNLEEDAFSYARSKLKAFFGIFSLRTEEQIQLTEEMVRMQRQREKAKRNKDFQEADRLREEFKIKFKINSSDTGTGATFTET